MGLRVGVKVGVRVEGRVRHREGFSRIGRSSAVASNVFLESLTTRQSADSHNLMVVLAHLQGVHGSV